MLRELTELANIDLTDIFSTSRKTQVTVLSRVASLISVMLMLILWFVISDPQHMGAHTQRRSRGFCRFVLCWCLFVSVCRLVDVFG